MKIIGTDGEVIMYSPEADEAVKNVKPEDITDVAFRTDTLMQLPTEDDYEDCLIVTAERVFYHRSYHEFVKPEKEHENADWAYELKDAGQFGELQTVAAGLLAGNGLCDSVGENCPTYTVFFGLKNETVVVIHGVCGFFGQLAGLAECLMKFVPDGEKYPDMLKGDVRDTERVETDEKKMTPYEMSDYLEKNTDKIRYDLDTGRYEYLVDKSLLPADLVAELDRSNEINDYLEEAFAEQEKRELN